MHLRNITLLIISDRRLLTDCKIKTNWLNIGILKVLGSGVLMLDSLLPPLRSSDKTRKLSFLWLGFLLIP
jgi:hypothetical protein